MAKPRAQSNGDLAGSARRESRHDHRISNSGSSRVVIIEKTVGVAQLAEHRTVAPDVVGSIPISHPSILLNPSSTNRFRERFFPGKNSRRIIAKGSGKHRRMFGARVLPKSLKGVWWRYRESNLRRLAGVSGAGASCRNPERSEGPLLARA